MIQLLTLSIRSYIPPSPHHSYEDVAWGAFEMVFKPTRAGEVPLALVPRILTPPSQQQ